jgi:hypothetical protein
VKEIKHTDDYKIGILGRGLSVKDIYAAVTTQA